jgi:hypothetical protein
LPCRKTNEADRFTVGLGYGSNFETAYHHFAGVNLPAACSIA